jgi:hypothetical protein
MAADLRARALVASQEMAFSSCGGCQVASLREVTPNLVETRFARRTRGMPSQCIFIAPKAYRPMRPGILPPGVSWGECDAPSAPLEQSSKEWLRSPIVGLATRRRARTTVAQWLADRCTTRCSIAALEPLTPAIWKVRTAGPLTPSPCFYLIFGTAPAASERASVSCAAD